MRSGQKIRGAEVKQARVRELFGLLTFDVMGWVIVRGMKGEGLSISKIVKMGLSNLRCQTETQREGHKGKRGKGKRARWHEM